MIKDNEKPKYKSSMDHYGYEGEELDRWYDEEMLKERAWMFYQSGVQDMREIKSLICVYKF